MDGLNGIPTPVMIYKACVQEWGVESVCVGGGSGCGGPCTLQGLESHSVQYRGMACAVQIANQHASPFSVEGSAAVLLARYEPGMRWFTTDLATILSVFEAELVVWQSSHHLPQLHGLLPHLTTARADSMPRRARICHMR